MLFPILGQSVYLLWWPSLTKDCKQNSSLCWSGITGIEHTTSGSNEEDLSLFLFSEEIKHIMLSKSP